jgi:hypothetical protein
MLQPLSRWRERGWGEGGAAVLSDEAKCADYVAAADSPTATVTRRAARAGLSRRRERRKAEVLRAQTGTSDIAIPLG